MKLHLASFMQPENFGEGRIISITFGSKPNNISVKSIFEPFAPPTSLINEYNSLRTSDPEKASKLFITSYTEQLESFFNDLVKESEKEGCSVINLLPFKDGDTLCSWERKDFTNFRKILAPFLEKVGYEVVLA